MCRESALKIVRWNKTAKQGSGQRNRETVRVPVWEPPKEVYPLNGSARTVPLLATYSVKTKAVAVRT